jgi:hypothetical protein
MPMISAMLCRFAPPRLALGALAALLLALGPCGLALADGRYGGGAHPGSRAGGSSAGAGHAGLAWHGGSQGWHGATSLRAGPGWRTSGGYARGGYAAYGSRGYSGYGYRGYAGYGRSGYGYRGFYGRGLGYGLFLAALPLYYATYWWNGIPYYYADDTYYIWNGGVGRYETVVPPEGIAQEAPAENAGELYVYPRRGQSSEQQARDRYECHRWAAEQSGFDPSQGAPGAAAARADYRRAQSACLEARDYSVR